MSQPRYTVNGDEYILKKVGPSMYEIFRIGDYDTTKTSCGTVRTNAKSKAGIHMAIKRALHYNKIYDTDRIILKRVSVT